MDGNLVSSPEFSMSIVSGRIGIIAMAIFVSAVLAYPCGTKQKVTGGPKLPEPPRNGAEPGKKLNFLLIDNIQRRMI